MLMKALMGGAAFTAAKINPQLPGLQRELKREEQSLAPKACQLCDDFHIFHVCPVLHEGGTA